MGNRGMACRRRTIRADGSQCRSGPGWKRRAVRRTRFDHALYRPNDADVAGATAQIAAHRDTDFTGAGIGHSQHDVTRRSQHARGAIAALQRMLARKRGAQRLHHLVFVESFDRRDVGAVAGDGKRDAGAGRHGIDHQRARAADPVLAAEMRAGEPERVPQEVRETRPGLDVRRDRPAVHGEVDRRHANPALSAARFNAATWIWLSKRSLMPAEISTRAAAPASNALAPAMGERPANSDAASPTTIGVARVAPKTARKTARSGS